jgi:hypothetical protein
MTDSMRPGYALVSLATHKSAGPNVPLHHNSGVKADTAGLRMWVIRDRVKSGSCPAVSAMSPKAEVNSPL